MTWGEYFIPVGFVAGAAVLAVGAWRAFKRNRTDDASAVGLVLFALIVGICVTSISLLDKEYVAQRHQKEVDARAKAEYVSRLDQLATQLYEEYLETAPTRELIVYMKDRTTPSRFVEAAREQLKSEAVIGSETKK